MKKASAVKCYASIPCIIRDLFSHFTAQDAVEMDISYGLTPLRPYLTWQALATLCLGVVLSTILHRRYLSPISDVPGPFIASLTRLWQTREVLLGRGTLTVTALHRTHGPFVRIAPGEVSVSHPDAPRKLLLATLPKVSRPSSGPRGCG